MVRRRWVRWENYLRTQGAREAACKKNETAVSKKGQNLYFVTAGILTASQRRRLNAKR